MARRLVLAAASLGVLVVLAAGCGGRGDAGIRDTSAWADDLCSASATWQGLMNDKLRSIERAKTRARLQTTVDDAKGMTEAFVGVLTGLGQPNTAQGAEAADTVNGLAADLLNSADSLDGQITRSSTTAGAVEVARNVVTTMTNETAATLGRLVQLDPNGEIGDAFRTSSSCRDARAGAAA